MATRPFLLLQVLLLTLFLTVNTENPGILQDVTLGEVPASDDELLNGPACPMVKERDENNNIKYTCQRCGQKCFGVTGICAQLFSGKYDKEWNRGCVCVGIEGSENHN